MYFNFFFFRLKVQNTTTTQRTIRIHIQVFERIRGEKRDRHRVGEHEPEIHDVSLGLRLCGDFDDELERIRRPVSHGRWKQMLSHLFQRSAPHCLPVKIDDTLGRV